MALRRVALRGADFVLHAMGAFWVRRGGTNNAALVVECDGIVDPERLAQSLRRFLDACPWIGGRLGRPFPWGALGWQIDETRVPPVVRFAADGRAARPHVEAELNEPIDPGREPPLRLRVVHHPGGTSTLVVTWYHPLMDPKGAEWLVAALAAPDERLPDSLVAPEDERPLRARGAIAMRGIPHLRALQREPPTSLAAAASRTGAVRWRHVACTAPDDADRRTRELTYRLAVVGRALAELFAKRDLPPLDYVVPIAVDRRRKGESGPVVGNYVGIHFARFAPDAASDPELVAGRLRAQLADAVRENLIEANWVGMDFMRQRPVLLAQRDLHLSPDGDICSFNCADTGATAVASAPLCGATIRNAYHVPGIYPRPGIGVLLNRCGPHHNLVVVWVDGVVDEPEVEHVIAHVRSGLGWT